MPAFAGTLKMGMKLSQMIGWRGSSGLWFVAGVWGFSCGLRADTGGIEGLPPPHHAICAADEELSVS